MGVRWAIANAGRRPLHSIERMRDMNAAADYEIADAMQNDRRCEMRNDAPLLGQVHGHTPTIVCSTFRLFHLVLSCFVCAVLQNENHANENWGRPYSGCNT